MKPRGPAYVLPEKFEGLHDHQVVAVDEIMGLYDADVKVVFLDAPTGAGKTVIAEVVRQRLRANAIYMCTTLSLQEQFLRDFDYAKVLKGRRNYTPTDSGLYITCEDCDRTKLAEDEYECSYCLDTELCPYRNAKDRAQKADLAVLNTAYFLAESMNPKTTVFGGRDLGIIDECDLLEGALVNRVEFTITKAMVKDLRITVPKKGSHKTTVQAWIQGPLKQSLRSRIRQLQSDEPETQRMKRRYSNLLEQAEQIDLTDTDYWVRDVKSYNPLSYKPYRVHLWGQKMVWQKAKRWLCMSGSIISADLMAESLGLEDHEWDVVHVPMTFPEENRPIVFCNVGQMTRQHQPKTLPAMVKAINEIAAASEGQNILIHAVSYKLSEELANAIESEYHTIHTYQKAKERDHAISLFDRQTGVIVVAPSLDRGIDLDGDRCRVQIIAKIPYPYLGDPLVSARMNDTHGNLWYSTETARTIVQATGRAVRGPEDVAITYILDGSYSSHLKRGGKGLLPKWWQDSVKVVATRNLTDHQEKSMPELQA